MDILKTLKYLGDKVGYIQAKHSLRDVNNRKEGKKYNRNMAFTREGTCGLKALLVAQLAQKGFKISFTVLQYFGGTQ